MLLYSQSNRSYIYLLMIKTSERSQWGHCGFFVAEETGRQFSQISHKSRCKDKNPGGIKISHQDFLCWS